MKKKNYIFIAVISLILVLAGCSNETSFLEKGAISIRINDSISKGIESSILMDVAYYAIEVHAGDSKIVNKDYAAFLSGCTDKFDIVFLDPPYSIGLLQEALSKLDKVIKDTSTVICEHPYGENVPEFAGNLPKFRQYKYGKVAVTVYKRGEIDG